MITLCVAGYSPERPAAGGRARQVTDDVTQVQVAACLTSGNSWSNIITRKALWPEGSQAAGEDSGVEVVDDADTKEAKEGHAEGWQADSHRSHGPSGLTVRLTWLFPAAAAARFAPPFGRQAAGSGDPALRVTKLTLAV